MDHWFLLHLLNTHLLNTYCVSGALRERYLYPQGKPSDKGETSANTLSQSVTGLKGHKGGTNVQGSEAVVAPPPQTTRQGFHGGRVEVRG